MFARPMQRAWACYRKYGRHLCDRPSLQCGTQTQGPLFSRACTTRMHAKSRDRRDPPSFRSVCRGAFSSTTTPTKQLRQAHHARFCRCFNYSANRTVRTTPYPTEKPLQERASKASIKKYHELSKAAKQWIPFAGFVDSVA